MTNQQHRRWCRALAPAVFCLAVMAPSFAAALPAGLDPVVDPDARAPVVDDAVDRVTEVIDEPVRAVIDEPVRAVIDPVRDAAEPVSDALDEPLRSVIDQVADAVADALPNAPAVIEDPPRPADARVDRNDAGVRPRDVRHTTNADATGADRSDGAPAAGSPVRTGPARTAAAVDPGAPRAGAVEDAPLATAGRGLRDAATAFRFPLLVGAAVALFLAVQSRLDRRDPKLAGTAADEELQFA